MQLISILVVIVAVLTILAGVTIAFGARKDKKTSPLLFSFAAFGASLWSLSIISFLSLPENAIDVAPYFVAMIYVSAVLMMVAIFGYVARFLGFSYTLLIPVALIGVVLMVLIIVAAPDLLYSDIVLNDVTGNVVKLRPEWLYISYIGFFIIVTLAQVGLLIARIVSKKMREFRKPFIVLLVGLGVCGLCSLCFDLLLPLVRYDLIWVGPLSVGAVIISLYYTVLRYRLITIKGNWLKIMSYVVIMSAAAVIYVMIFFVMFTVLFPVSSPSFGDLVLNFAMVIIVFLSTPFVANMTANIRSILSTENIDIGYVAKKLTKISANDVNFKELAGFLASHMHFSYVGFLVDGKLMGSKENIDFDAKEVEIKSIQSDGNDADQLLIDMNKDYDVSLSQADLRVVSGLRRADGEDFGMIVFGAPHNVGKYSDDDMKQFQMVLDLVEIAVCPKK